MMTDYMRGLGRCWNCMAFVVVMATGFCLLGCSRGGDGRDVEAGNDRDAARESVTYAALRAENEALRRENQMLRRELISKNGKLPDAVLPEKGSDAGFAVEPEVEDTGYWLSTNSKVRHNKRCRNYRKVKGRPCGPDEGRPCGICGG